MIAPDARPDVARIRLDNALAMFDEFVRATVKHPDAATLRGLEGRFAERLQIQPSYWSQIKSRARQIGERLARQFERLCHKPHGWMDEVHGASPARVMRPDPTRAPGGAGPTLPKEDGNSAPDAGLVGALDDDERFIVGLVLTYYRRHPQRARARLLELLGEVLTLPAAKPASGTKASAVAEHEDEDEKLLWERTRKGVAPLRHKRR